MNIFLPVAAGVACAYISHSFLSSTTNDLVAKYKLPPLRKPHPLYLAIFGIFQYCIQQIIEDTTAFGSAFKLGMVSFSLHIAANMVVKDVKEYARQKQIPFDSSVEDPAVYLFVVILGGPAAFCVSLATIDLLTFQTSLLGSYYAGYLLTIKRLDRDSRQPQNA